MRCLFVTGGGCNSTTLAAQFLAAANLNTTQQNPSSEGGAVHIMKPEASLPYSKQLPTSHYSEINVSRSHILYDPLEYYPQPTSNPSKLLY